MKIFFSFFFLSFFFSVNASNKVVQFHYPDRKDLPFTENILKEIKNSIEFKQNNPAEKVAISGAVYRFFNNKEILSSFEVAASLGIKIEILFGDNYPEIKEFQKKNIENIYFKFCIKKLKNCSANGILHAKFFLFSYNKTAILSSSNLDIRQNSEYNDTIVFSNNEELFDSLKNFWNFINLQNNASEVSSDLFSQKLNQDLEIFYFPQPFDPVIEFLSNPGCELTEIKIIHGDNIRKDLGVKLKEFSSNVSKKIDAIVNYRSLEDYKKYSKDNKQFDLFVMQNHEIHNKLLLAYCSDQTRYIFTGSHNLKKASLKDNYEVLLKIKTSTEDPLFIKYQEFYKMLKEQSLKL